MLRRLRRPSGDGGNALIEFTYLAVLLMVPLVYVLLTVFLVQRASFGVTEAARQAGRAYARTEDVALAGAAARLALSDQSIDCDDCLGRPRVTEAPDPAGGEPDRVVTVQVSYFVRLPLIGSFFRGQRAGLTVDATHVELVDRFAASPR